MAAPQPEQQGESHSSLVSPRRSFQMPDALPPSGGRQNKEGSRSSQACLVACFPLPSFLCPWARLAPGHFQRFALLLSRLCHVEEITVSCPYHRRHSHACCRPLSCSMIADLVRLWMAFRSALCWIAVKPSFKQSLPQSRRVAH